MGEYQSCLEEGGSGENDTARHDSSCVALFLWAQRNSCVDRLSCLPSQMERSVAVMMMMMREGYGGVEAIVVGDGQMMMTHWYVVEHASA